MHTFGFQVQIPIVKRTTNTSIMYKLKGAQLNTFGLSAFRQKERSKCRWGPVPQELADSD